MALEDLLFAVGVAFACEGLDIFAMSSVGFARDEVFALGSGSSGSSGREGRSKPGEEAVCQLSLDLSDVSGVLSRCKGRISKM
jgi:hypothetical protein